MRTFKKLLFLLTSYERKRAGLLLMMIIIMALLDIIGVASILPFIAVLTNPGLIETNVAINTMYQTLGMFGVESNQQFFFVLGILVFGLLIISLSFKAFTNYTQVRFVQMCEYSIGNRLIEGYLHQPYSWFLSRHSTDLGKTILSEVSQVIAYGINPLIELIAKSIVAIAIISLLILIDPKLALIAGFSISTAYGLVFFFVRKYLNRIGDISLKSNQLRFTAVNEAFSAAKEVKVGGLEKIYIKLFSKSAYIFARNQSNLLVISQLPRLILEAIVFGGILLILLYIMNQEGTFNRAIPILSLYVFAAYRLMPAIQQIYGSFTQLTFVGASLHKLYEDLKNLKTFNKDQDQGILSFNKTICLKNIHYNYPNTTRTTLKNISLTIHEKSTVGLVGATGCGKTSIVDTILGLLEPQQGTLEVDGKVIKKHNVRSWQRSIGYVPQHIYLSDDTVAANIAFGIESKDIDYNMIIKAAKIANLHEFVIDQLPKKYQTSIGERGIRLSGGQRQRIGIARALYHNPQVLILDEATSALDNQTEKVVMDAISNLSKNITIILIAHRLSTVEMCDNIFVLENGQLMGHGTYQQLKTTNKTFQKMIRGF